MIEDRPYEEVVRGYDLKTLEDVLSHLNRDRFPDRYELVLAEIERKKGEAGKERVEEPSPLEITDVRAGFWRRTAALIIDGFVLMLLSFFLISIVMSVGKGITKDFSETKAALIAMSAAATVLCMFYFIFLHAKSGQTMGKMGMKIKVLRAGGGPINLGIAAFRYVIYFFLAYDLATVASLARIPGSQWDVLAHEEKISLFNQHLVLFSIMITTAFFAWTVAEVTCLLADPKKRALHDFIAGTKVVKLGP